MGSTKLKNTISKILIVIAIVLRMSTQNRFFEHLFFCVVVLLLLPCNKLVAGVTSVLGDGTEKSGCMENERAALLMFKKGLVDDYDILSSWGSEDDKKDCCKWRGIKCDNRTGHVITLDLHNEDAYFKSLQGNISPSLLELQHLKHLDLSSNYYLEIRIPKLIGSLSSLLYLNLRETSFFGTIPHQLGNLTNLRALLMGSPYLSVENLEWLSNLRSLRHLDLSHIDLGKIDLIQSIDKLSFLSELHLVSCNLQGIISPSHLLTNFSSIPLTTIDLSRNKFTSSSYNWLFNFSSTLVDIDMSSNPFGGSIPDAFGNMMSLKNLSLNDCSFEGGIPKSFKNLSRLQSLELLVNNLTDQLPEIFETLNASKNSLEILDLTSNKVSGSLPDFTRFSSLRELWLGHNKLQGSIPKIFGQTSLLDSLDLSFNELNGSFPDLTSFLSLRYLALNHNKLKGRLPKSIGQLSNLKELYLSFNLLTLEFNSDWTPLFQLDVIHLGNCKLGPHFPEWLQSQNNFSELDISSANISDTIPYWFWDLSPILRYLNISNNQIHGMLPDLSLEFQKLPAIDLSSNHFKGPIPLFPHNVTLLNLSKNMFSGSIISLCTIAPEFLSSLDLSDNQLSGEVPDCWIFAKKLEILDLGNNYFSGKIPASFGFLLQLRLLNLRNNNFTGELPSSLKNCTALKVIDMSENKLSGQVPAWIGTHLTSLLVLIFQRNEFCGSIPSSICHLNLTQVLDLSQNKILGNIPQCLNKLNSLTQTESSSVAVTIESSSRGGAYDDDQEVDYFSMTDVYIARELVQWKGKESEYSSTLGLLKYIDLSSNKLVGKIPEELASLEGLGSLNLSRNNLTGDIMQSVSQLKRLEVLDLSRNQLSGELPRGLASLSWLSVLDLSNNNFSGKIPLGTQLQSFNPYVYAGNRELCGLPLLNKCPGEDELASVPPSTDHGKDETNEEDEDKFVSIGFYISAALGFTVAFWGFFGPLLIRSSWRYAYFKFLDKIKDWMCVTIAVNMARLQRKLGG